MLKCDDLYVFERAGPMKLLAIMRFPSVEKTVSVEKGNQTFIYGSSRSRLFQAELLIRPFNTSLGQSMSVIFDMGFDTRQVLIAKRNFTLQRMNQDYLVLRYAYTAPGTDEEQLFYQYQACSYKEHRVAIGTQFQCARCPEYTFTLWFG
jgi:hypothetical protein